jgi:hypothetical protein
MRRLFALALLLAFAAACQQDGERQAATTTTATATTVEPTTTTKPPATPAEKAWIAGVRKLRQRMDRVFHQSGIVLTQAKIGEFIATARSCRPALARLGSPSDRLAAAVTRASRACRDYGRAADAYRRVLPYIAVGSGSPRVEELLQQTSEHEGNGSNGLRDAEAMAQGGTAVTNGWL